MVPMENNAIRGEGRIYLLLACMYAHAWSSSHIHIFTQLGIHGICHSNYFIEEDPTSKELYITQIVDINNCQERAAMYSGMALAIQNRNCKEVVFLFCSHFKLENSKMMQMHRGDQC